MLAAFQSPTASYRDIGFAYDVLSRSESGQHSAEWPWQIPPSRPLARQDHAARMTSPLFMAMGIADNALLAAADERLARSPSKETLNRRMPQGAFRPQRSKLARDRSAVRSVGGGR